MTFKSCLTSMRLRTLPLSLSGVLMGIFIAASRQPLSALAVALLIATTVLLQILSNLSNELGDTLQGTDNDDRQGIHYSLQDGTITIPEMKRLIFCVAIGCALCGTGMVWASFGTLLALEPLLLLMLGAGAMAAAMRAAGAGGAVVAFGSLYAAGAVRGIYRSRFAAPADMAQGNRL